MSNDLPTLQSYIQNYVPLSSADWEQIEPYFKRRMIDVGEHLLEEGEICRHLHFVESGLFHYYILKDGTPRTKFFTIAPYLFTSQRSFNEQIPAQESIQAIELSIVWSISYDDHQKLMALPSWNLLARKVTQEVQFFTEQILEDLQNETAEARYRHLLENQPDLLQRIPLRFLASYLGIAPQSLSRIRQKIATKARKEALEEAKRRKEEEAEEE
jgi:CRP-like cAMP-binding protein